MVKRYYFNVVLGILFIGILSALSYYRVIASPSLSQADRSEEYNANVTAALAGNSCRAGASGSFDAFAWVDTIGLGWVSTYDASRISLLDANYMPIVRLKSENDYTSYSMSPDASTLSSLAASYPGRIWQIGNEPDIRSQDNMSPQLYAQAFHAAYTAIKEGDPTATVSTAPLAMLTPSRLQYWDLVWDAYQEFYNETIPADIWSTHVYLIGEGGAANVAVGTDGSLATLGGGDASTCWREDVICRSEHDDPDLFETQLRAMRQWMKDHGQREKPLIVTEWSVLWPYVIDNPGTPEESCFLADEFGNCFPPDRVNKYMDATINVLNSTDPDLGYSHDNDRLVQRYLWFSLYISPEYGGGGGASNLLKDNYIEYGDGNIDALSDVGLNYKEMISTQADTVNLHIIDTQSIGLIDYDDGVTPSAKLRVRYNNNGNHNIQQPFTVSFYHDSELTDLIGSSTIDPLAYGCGTFDYEVELDWKNLPLGVHQYWVKLDSDDVIVETDESRSDNIGMGIVFVGKHGQHLPTIIR